MLIGEVAKRARINSSAIRYYESIGLLPRAVRSSGRRHFGEDILVRLILIQRAKDMDFSLREIGTLLAGFSPKSPPPEKWKALALRKIGELERRISEATQMKALLEAVLRCRCIESEDCLRYLGNGA